MLDNPESVPVKRNSMICPCCLQYVDDVRFLADPNTHMITNGERSVRLTAQQFRLAKFLIDVFPRVATKEAIYDAAFLDAHGEGPAMKIVEVIICKIRPVMAELGLVIQTVWGKGYKLVEAQASEALLIKDQSIRLRTPGTAKRWSEELDTELLGLMQRRMSVTQCASIMKMPYMAVERHFKKLQPLLEASR